jgi:hypothetical protein
MMNFTEGRNESSPLALKLIVLKGDYAPTVLKI